MSEQLAIVYLNKLGEPVIYTTAYDHPEANMQKARCVTRHPGRHTRIVEAKSVPFSSVGEPDL